MRDLMRAPCSQPNEEREDRRSSWIIAAVVAAVVAAKREPYSIRSVVQGR